MKKQILLSIVFLISIASHAQAPNASEWLSQKKTQINYLVQQIAALQVHLGYLKKGYSIARKGLGSIGRTKDGTFALDKAYFSSLQAVSPVVGNSPLVNEILLYRQAINARLKKLHDDCSGDRNFSPGETGYIKSICQSSVAGCSASIDELTVITTAGSVEMSDDNRLVRLAKIHADIRDRYDFAMDFDATVRALAQTRQKEQRDLQKVNSFTNNL